MNTADKIKVIQGDITELALDAIANAANQSLLGGGGVDGAIHRAAGPELLKECRTIGGCPTGEARMTSGYQLPAKHVIHTVGPVWNGGRSGEEAKLRSCYRNSLALCAEHELKTIAFPCISTGIYGYPKDEACRVAVETVREWLDSHDLPEEVTFCCFGIDDFELYSAALSD